MKRKTTIQVDEETYNLIDKYGERGETFNDIIKRVFIKVKEGKENE
jgi:hypothetical protein